MAPPESELDGGVFVKLSIRCFDSLHNEGSWTSIEVTYMVCAASLTSKCGDGRSITAIGLLVDAVHHIVKTPNDTS